MGQNRVTIYDLIRYELEHLLGAVDEVHNVEPYTSSDYGTYRSRAGVAEDTDDVKRIEIHPLEVPADIVNQAARMEAASGESRFVFVAYLLTEAGPYSDDAFGQRSVLRESNLDVTVVSDRLKPVLVAGDFLEEYLDGKALNFGDAVDYHPDVTETFDCVEIQFVGESTIDTDEELRAITYSFSLIYSI